MSKVVIIGGGAAGMFGAIQAASNGHQVSLYEQNEKLGKKLFITGKGRCNLTNAGDVEDLLLAVRSNPKFLYSSFYQFNSRQMIEFMENAGLPLKIERGNRVFPQSDHSSDVIQILSKTMRDLNVDIFLNTKIEEIIFDKAGVRGVRSRNLRTKEVSEISCDICMIATGGISYATTGATGDGYRFAKQAGHRVSRLYPSLVPMNVKEAYVKDLQGLSLKNVTLTICKEDEPIYEEFGEMMFTHFGITGPIVLKASSEIGPVLYPDGNPKGIELAPVNLAGIIDLKPKLSFEQLDARVLREFDGNHNKQFKNILGSLFPQKLIPIMIYLSEIPEDKKIHEITKEERQRFVTLMKHFPMTIIGLRGFKEAIITKGGVEVDQINPSTMESKLVPRLYFIGEVLDLDAYTGGYNLQIAWSTAYEAGNALSWC